MAKQKSDILSGMGSGYEIVKTIVDEVKNRGGGDDDVRRILSDRELQGRIGDLIMGNGQETTPATPTTYPVTINYEVTTEEHLAAPGNMTKEQVRFARMLAAGRYDWQNSDINEKNFPVTGEGVVTRVTELAHYGTDMSSQAVLVVIDAQGYRPATIEELLAFGEKYPELQREFPIVALGSVWRSWNGRRGVASLGRNESERYLDLGWLGDGWRGHCRFLVVRK